MSTTFDVTILDSVVESANTTTAFVLDQFNMLKDTDIETATKIITDIIAILKKLFRLTGNGTLIEPTFTNLDENIIKALTESNTENLYLLMNFIRHVRTRVRRQSRIWTTSTLSPLFQDNLNHVLSIAHYCLIFAVN
jgi:hypothetical protein